MDAILLLLQCIGILLVMRWLLTGPDEGGLLGWSPPAPNPPARRPRR